VATVLENYDVAILGRYIRAVEKTSKLETEQTIDKIRVIQEVKRAPRLTNRDTSEKLQYFLGPSKGVIRETFHRRPSCF
jgi:hypothetical protein